MEGQTNLKKRIVAHGNFASAPEN